LGSHRPELPDNLPSVRALEVIGHMFLRVFLPLLLPAWLLSACGSCSADPPTPSQDLGTSPDFTVGETPSLPPEEPYEPTAQDYLDNGIPLWATESGTFDGRIFLAAGKVDFANHHTSTVMISMDEPLAAAECSGVLLTPSLVLTAASCVCAPQKVTSPKGKTTTLFDSSACSPSLRATAVVYGNVINEYIAEMEMPSSRGAVRPHPDFKLLLDEQQAVMANHADLAVLVLERPIPGKIRPASLSSQEVQAQEVLTMVGFGYGKEFGQIFGLRFVRRDKVLGEAPSNHGRFLYEQQGAFLYNGFIGGPCFQEKHGRYVLAGIASIGTPQELSYTSAYAHREWLESEIQRAAKLARHAHQKDATR
jgi:hypothetical protein